jgi:hypothetical protein
LATAIAWLVTTNHVSRESRIRMQLSDAVWAARRALRDTEARFRARA